jgi:7-hydroxymethyl chlorophyll a reductase
MHISGVDNGRRGTLEKFLEAASTRPDEVLHYEFMQDYRVSFLRV